MEEEINMLDEIEETSLNSEDDDETFELWLPSKTEYWIKCVLGENDFVVEDNDVTTFDLRPPVTMEEEINFSEVIEETDFIVEENDVNTCDLGLDKAKHNLDNAKQQMELMVEENKSLKATIENKNKHILETENKAAKGAKAAFVWYTNSNNQLKDVIHQANKNHVQMQMEKDQLQEQLQKLTKIKNAEAKDQRKMIDHLKKKMAEVENENNKNAKTAERSHRRKNECKQQLKATLMQSEKERITSQRTIANLQNNIRTLNEELKEYKKSVSNSEAEKIVSQRTITKLQTNIRNLLKELNDLKKGFSSVTDKLRGAEQKVIELTKNIDDQTQDKETASAKLDKLEKENEYLVNQLRSTEFKIELLNNSHETERKKHESSMKWMHKRCSENEIELEKHKNAHFNLLLQLDRVHNNSRISMEDTALLDKTFIEQKLEDERAKEEDLAEVTTNVIKKFASANDRHRVIKSFQKRIEKGSCSSPFGNDFLSDEDSHMERFPTSLHEHTDTKQYNERLEENQNCQNKTEKNTNVFNINMNIAKSNVSFIDKKEERTLCLNGGSSDHTAIEGKEQL